MTDINRKMFYQIADIIEQYPEKHNQEFWFMNADCTYTAGYRVAEIDSMSGNASVEVNSKFIDFENLMKHPGAIYGD
jgi:hypothetical protein